MWTEIFILAIGIFIGICLTIWAEFLALEKDNIKDFVKKKLPHKMGSIEGLSEEEENFKNSLKTKEDTKIT